MSNDQTESYKLYVVLSVTNDNLGEKALSLAIVANQLLASETRNIDSLVFKLAASSHDPRGPIDRERYANLAPHRAPFDRVWGFESTLTWA